MAILQCYFLPDVEKCSLQTPQYGNNPILIRLQDNRKWIHIIGISGQRIPGLLKGSQFRLIEFQISDLYAESEIPGAVVLEEFGVRR